MSARGFVPLSRPTIEEEEIGSVVDCLRSGWLTSGPKVLAFESAFRARLGVRHAVAVNSATAGLHLTLAAIGIGPGDEVITTSLTWPSTVNAIELLGARPVFADVVPDGLLIDIQDVARRITDRTRAVIPVHYAGAPVDLDVLDSVIADSPIVVLHDAAHALGTVYKRREIGAHQTSAERDATVFSFHPIKNITTGEGGMVLTQDGRLAERLRLLRFHGVTKDAWTHREGQGSAHYEVIEPGWKYNMLDLQAALGIEQLAKLDRFNHDRAELAARYDELLAGISEIRPIGRPQYQHDHAWHLYVVKLDLDRLPMDRDQFMRALAEEGVGSGLHFSPVHLHRYYAEKYGYRVGDLPVTETAGEAILSLPLYPAMTYVQQDQVVSAVKKVISVETTS
ncbi:MAG: DegT/DnrJ/EryC1/StrS family aminotransferase [Pseudonocardiaceae bacterium]